jgi:hypothetical protein
MSLATDTMQAISPKPPAPLYPDVPWWAVLITALVFAVVGILFGVYGMKKVEGIGSSGVGALSIAVDTVSYMPHILLLFGVLADMFSLDGVWSIPSLIGVLSIFANYVFQYFWKGIDELVKTGNDAYKKGLGDDKTSGGGKGKQKGGELFKGYTGCNVQGFESFSSKYAPQTLVVTATVFSYYCYDLIRNRGWINSIAAILAFFAAYVGEVAVIDFQNPVTPGTETIPATGGCGGTGQSAIAGGVRALFEGLLFGGVGFGIVQTYAPTRLPSSTISPFPRKTAADLSPGPDGKMYDADGYAYVVLPNGQAVPDLSDAKSRAAYGELAGAATGEKTTVGGNCPGVAAKCPSA